VSGGFIATQKGAVKSRELKGGASTAAWAAQKMMKPQESFLSALEADLDRVQAKMGGSHTPKDSRLSPALRLISGWTAMVQGDATQLEKYVQLGFSMISTLAEHDEALNILIQTAPHDWRAAQALSSYDAAILGPLSRLRERACFDRFGKDRRERMPVVYLVPVSRIDYRNSPSIWPFEGWRLQNGEITSNVVHAVSDELMRCSYPCASFFRDGAVASSLRAQLQERRTQSCFFSTYENPQLSKYQLPMLLPLDMETRTTDSTTCQELQVMMLQVYSMLMHMNGSRSRIEVMETKLGVGLEWDEEYMSPETWSMKDEWCQGAI